ncbi:MAG: hypothetical protein H6708_16945 [Kofleriaceae bacterium]|nr:hypothetical protein [Myxococcales bacterium]MCB9562093.1 hypothetical protein [Kofleriaceae bacterium]
MRNRYLIACTVLSALACVSACLFDRPADVTDDASVLDAASLDAAPCGGTCTATQICLADECVACGELDQPCCALDACTATGATCAADSCGCPTAWTTCDAACVDTRTDEAHCGDCTSQCASGQACSAGACRAPALYAIHGDVVRVGDEIVLDGIFGPAASVNFAGAVTATAIVDGTHRARVTVPSGATSGPVTVTTLAQTTSAIRIRIASFALGLGPFRTRYEQAGYAQTTPTLVVARTGAAVIATRRWVYVVGGASAGGTPLASIERARVNADGSLGPFALAGSLGVARAYAGASRIGDRVYVVGGTGGTALDSVESAALDPDDNLGAFADAGVTLASPRGAVTTTVVGASLYALGGGSSIERAPILADGTVGAFGVSGALTRPRIRAAAVATATALYVIGGDDGGALDTIERAPIDGEGAVGSFAVLSTTLAQGRAGAGAVALDGYLYVVGGGGGNPVTATDRAMILDDGTLSAFSSTPASLVTGRQGASMTVVGNYLYAIGGAAAGGVPQPTIERAGLPVAPTIGAFTATGATVGVRSRGALAIDHYVYTVTNGQGDPSNGVERADVGDGGGLGAFATVATTFTPARNDPSLAVVGNYVYALGGTYNPGVCCDVSTSIVRAPIDGSGAIGAFGAAGALTAARNGAAAIVVEPYLYVIGGNDANGRLTSVERAVINTDGSLGGFANAGVTLQTGRTIAAAAVLGDYLYVLGGSGDSDSLASVERAQILANGSLGAFTTLSTVTLDISRINPGAVVEGDRLFIVGGYSQGGGGAAADPGEVSVISHDGTLGAFAASGATTGADKSSAPVVVDNVVYQIGSLRSAALAP